MAKKETKFLSLCSDTVFKALYKDSKLGKKWINKMIRYITDINVDDFVLIDSEINEGRDTKDSRLDLLLANSNTSTLINLEINRNYYPILDDKNSYYLHRIASSSFKQGEKYHKVIAIQINLNAFLNPYNINAGEFMYRMYDTVNKVFLKDETRLYSIYLPYYKNVCYNGQNEKEMMFSMLNAKSFDKLREIANGNEEALGIIKELEDIMNGEVIISSYEKERIEEYFDRGLKEQIRETAISEGLKEGLQEGREKGLQEGREKGLQEGREKGLQEGREKGLQEGREKGLQEGHKNGLDKSLEIIKLIKDGKTDDEIEKETSTSVSFIKEIRKNL